MSLSKSIVLIASGPSLSFGQVEVVKHFNPDVMVINDNYKIYPNAKYLFAADLQWWYKNYDMIDGDIIQCFTLKGHAKHLDRRIKGAYHTLNEVNYTSEFGLYDDKVHHGGNSGYIGLQLARLLGYNKIILIGFDCQHTYGKRHWFGDHKDISGSKNAEDVERWKNNFFRLSPLIDLDTDVVNCTIESSLTCFREGNLIEELFTII